MHVGKFATVECKEMVLLLDDGTNLLGGSISIDVEGLSKMGISEDDLLGDELFQLVEGGLAV